MKKAFFVFTCLLSIFAFAKAVPTGNQMHIGNISEILPVDEMREYYAAMAPVMNEYFGPPFSNFTIDIEAVANDSRLTEINSETNVLVLGPLADQWLKNKDFDRPHALANVFGQMEHELSHAMYIYEGQNGDLGSKWTYEGWANVMAELLDNRLRNFTRAPQLFYEYYLDKDTVAGTPADAQKQASTHSIQYGMATAAHLLLLSAGSTSNTNLDFYRRLNSAIYPQLSSKDKKASISFDEYKAILKKMLENKTIDGKDAYETYFNSPAFYTNGSTGLHIGVRLQNREDNLEPNNAVAFMFSREKSIINGREKIIEKPIPNANVRIEIKDAYGAVILKKEAITDETGDALIRLSDLPEFKNSSGKGALTLQATAQVGNTRLESKLFALYPPFISIKKEYLYGVLLDEQGMLLDGKYVALLKADSDVNVIYKKDGLFILEIPIWKREITLDFLNYTQKVTKGPFARVYALTVPAAYILLASQKNESELKNEFVDNTLELIQIPQNKNSKPNPDNPQVVKNSSCGDGVCQDFERQNQECQQDCRPANAPKMEQPINTQKNQPNNASQFPLKGFFEQIWNWIAGLLGSSARPN